MAPPSSNNSNSAQSGQVNNNSATKNTSNQPAAVTATTATEARPSRTAFAKEGWGSRMNFQLSYGLKPDNDDDWQEGKQILDTMIDHEMAQRRSGGAS